MKRIIKSQFYQLWTDKWLILCLIVMIAIVVGQWEMNISGIRENETESILNGIDGAVSILYNTEYCSGLVYLVLVFAVVIGKDYMDQNARHDIMAGYSVQQAFWGRFLTALIWGGGILLITTFSRVVYYTMKNGWGTMFSGTGYLACALVSILIFYRIIGEVTLVAAAVRRYQITVIIMAVLGILEMYAVLLFIVSLATMEGKQSVWFLSLPGLELLLHVSWVGGYEGTKYVSSYVQMPDIQVMAGSALLSVCIGTVCLWLAQKIVKNREIG